METNERWCGASRGLEAARSQARGGRGCLRAAIQASPLQPAGRERGASVSASAFSLLTVSCCASGGQELEGRGPCDAVLQGEERKEKAGEGLEGPTEEIRHIGRIPVLCISETSPPLCLMTTRQHRVGEGGGTGRAGGLRFSDGAAP